MKVLLDTHAFLWIIEDNPNLSEIAKELFLDPGNKLFFSVASMWEIAIKKSLGKLIIKGNWERIIKEELNVNGIQWLPIEPEHCVILEQLPFHHRDPFDRMIIAQAMRGEMKLLTEDARIKAYNVQCIW